jgi:tetratricopeptide (TPR) repeat protein
MTDSPFDPDDLCAEQDRQWSAGERPAAEDYLARYPGLATDAEALLDLIMNEVRLREAAGEQPTCREYAGRFPHLAGQLENEFEVHAAIEHGTRPWSTQGGGPTPSPSEPTPPPRGPVIPGYHVRGKIGSGAMGVIYRARDLRLNRVVAVKLLQDKYPPDSSVGRRFLEEAHITAQLQHPGIPPVHELGVLAGGRPFLVMKLVKGRTLDRILADGTVGRGGLVATFEQVCHAVGYAHDRGVVHRDLKPANVMVGAFGEVQVMDWGLAKVLTDARPEVAESDKPGTTMYDPREDTDEGLRTRAGSFLGTPAFMAPEQAIGAVDQIDERSDVFGLGAVLCAILTGEPPFAAATGESARQLAARGKMDDCFARLDTCGAEPELVALCKRCLAPDKAERPRNAAEVAAAVHAFRAEAEQRAVRAELDRVRAEGERAAAEVEAREQRKRRKTQLALACAVLVLLAGGGAFAWWQDRQATDRKLSGERAEAERLRIDGDRKAAEARAEAEADFKARQARQGTNASLALAARLRGQHQFADAAGALAQAADLARSGAPELLPEVDQARSDLEFVEKLDDIRFRKWVWSPDPGPKGRFNTHAAPGNYSEAFAGHGLDLAALDPGEAARRIAASAVKAELVAAVDDWALYEQDEALRTRLLEVARRADPGEWTDRLRNPAVWKDAGELTKLRDSVPAKTPATALSMLAALMMEFKGDGPDPAPLLTKARAEHPDKFELAFALGRWYTANSRDGQQIGPLEAARALRPENVAVLNNLGVGLRNRYAALKREDDLVAAVACYRAALRLDHTLAPAHTNLGVALMLLGDLKGATEAFDEAILHDPLFAPAWNNRAFVWQRKEDMRGAIANFQQAIKLDPKFAPAHTNLGMIYYVRLSNKPEGLAGAQAALAADPNYAPAHTLLGMILNDEEKYPEAMARAEAALANDRTYPPAHWLKGVVYFNQGNYRDAIDCAKTAIAANPNYADAHGLLGLVLRDTDDIFGARAALKKAADLDRRQWAGPFKNLPRLVAPPPRAK